MRPEVSISAEAILSWRCGSLRRGGPASFDVGKVLGGGVKQGALRQTFAGIPFREQSQASPRTVVRTLFI